MPALRVDWVDAVAFVVAADVDEFGATADEE